MSPVAGDNGTGDEQIQNSITHKLQPLVALGVRVGPGAMREGLHHQCLVLEAIVQVPLRPFAPLPLYLCLLPTASHAMCKRGQWQIHLYFCLMPQHVSHIRQSPRSCQKLDICHSQYLNPFCSKPSIARPYKKIILGYLQSFQYPLCCVSACIAGPGAHSGLRSWAAKTDHHLRPQEAELNISCTHQWLWLRAIQLSVA